LSDVDNAVGVRTKPADYLGAAEGRRDVIHEAVHLLAHKGVGTVAEVKVVDDLVDAGRLNSLQCVNDLLGRAMKQRSVVEVGRTVNGLAVKIGECTVS
jgi:hypothetical protein